MVMASDIPIDMGLRSSLGAIGGGQQNSIGNVYSRYKSMFSKDARPSGGNYVNDRLNTGLGESTGALRTGLEGALGDTGYTDFKNNRDYQQNYALAQRIGDLNKPSLLQQVLGGLGGGAQAGGQFYGLYNSLQRPSTPYTPSSTPNYSRFTSGGSGLNLY